MNSRNPVQRPARSAVPRTAVPRSATRSSGREETGSLSRSSSVSTVASIADSIADGKINFEVGERVWVNGTMPGVLEYIGETKFAPGIWAGVQLDDAMGRNDGSVAGTRYFDCEPDRGIFIRPQRLTRQAGTIPSVAGDLNLSASRQEHSPSSSLQSPMRPCLPLEVGERVVVTSISGTKTGTLRYIGPTSFADGEWAGIELDEPTGRNDGSIGGKRYFECEMNYGLFVPTHRVSRPGELVTPPSTSGLVRSRTYSRESLNSTTSSVASSRANRIKLGVTSLANNQSTKRSPKSVISPTQAALQDALKEKTEHIEQLLNEKDVERAEFARLAGQRAELGKELAKLEEKVAYFRNECEKAEFQAKNTLALLEVERKKNEDLQFQLEETVILKGDLEINKEKDCKRIKELESICRKEIENMKGHDESITDLLKEKENVIAEQEEALTNLKNTVTMKDTHLSEFNLQLRDALEKVSSHSEKLMVYQSAFARLNSEKQQLRQADQMSSEMPEAEDEECFSIIEWTVKQLANYQKEIGELKATLEKKDVEVSEISAHLKETERLYELKDKSDSDVATLESQLAEFRLEKEKHIHAKEENKRKFASEIENITNNLLTSQRMCLDTSSELVACKERLEQKGKMIQNMTNELNVAKEEILCLNKSKSETLQALEDKIQKLKSQSEMESAEFQQKLQSEKLAKDDALNSLQEKEHAILQYKNSLNESSVSQEKKISELTAELKKAMDEISGLSNSLTCVEHELTKAMSEKEQLIKEKEEDESIYTRKIKEFEKELLDKEKECTDSSSEVAVQREELGEYKRLIERMSAELKEAKEEIACLGKDKSEALVALQKKLEELKLKKDTEVADLEKKLQSQINEKENATNLLKERDHRISQQDDALANLKDSIAEKEDKILEFDFQLKETQRKADLLFTDVSCLERERDKLASEKQMSLREKEEAIRTIQADLTHFSTLYEERNAEVSKYQEEINSLKDLVDENNIKLGQLKDQKKLQEEIQDLQTILSQRNNKIERNNTLSTDLKSQVDKKDSELHSLQQQLQTFENDSSRNIEHEKGLRTELETQLHSLKSHCEKLELEKDKIAREVQIAEAAHKELESVKDALLADKQKQEILVKDREEKLESLQDEVNIMQEQFVEHKAELQHKLDISQMELQTIKEFKTELEVQHGVFEELQQQLSAVENERSKLQVELQQMSKVIVENQQLQAKVIELDSECMDSRWNAQKFAETEAEVRNLHHKLQGIQINMEEKQDEVEILKVQLKHSEKEKNDILSELAKLQFEASQKTSVIVDDDVDVKDQQIKFLNSIIVDLKRENEELKIKAEARIDMFETDFNFNGVKKIAPRLFCDICDLFDLHDTTDCPKQSSLVEEESMHSKHHGRRHEERPYCNNCEIFGHWTLDCDER